MALKPQNMQGNDRRMGFMLSKSRSALAVEVSEKLKLAKSGYKITCLQTEYRLARKGINKVNTTGEFDDVEIVRWSAA